MHAHYIVLCICAQMHDFVIVLSGFLSQGPVLPQMLQMTMSDSVFSYTCAVLCDGLLLLELCDAIHEEKMVDCSSDCSFLEIYSLCSSILKPTIITSMPLRHFCYWHSSAVQ